MGAIPIGNKEHYHCKGTIRDICGPYNWHKKNTLSEPNNCYAPIKFKKNI